MLKPGAKAPDFKAVDHDGKPVTLKDFRGKRKVALYFYPKDDTPGCTTQACNLRDEFDILNDAGIEVLGVSPDDGDSHRKFAAKHELPFRLLVDPEKKILNAYGVWGEKSMYGRTYMGVKRTTYLIREDGEIAAIIEKPKVSEHAHQIQRGFEA